MSKTPAIMLYTGDWMKDPALSMCSPAARGIWIDLLCVFHELGRSGQVTGTPDQLCRACRCTAAEFVEALTELKSTGTADISERNGRVTVINRRMQREFKERLATADRVQKYRRNAAVTNEPEQEENDVTDLKRQCNASSSSSITEESTTNVVEGKPPPKEKRVAKESQTDPRSKHPAIQTCRGLISCYPPKEIWDKIIGILGDEPDHLRMLDCLAEWVERGYKKTNWKWLTEWFVNGIPEAGGKLNGKTQSRQFETREQRNDRNLEETFRQIIGVDDEGTGRPGETKALSGDFVDYH